MSTPIFRWSGEYFGFIHGGRLFNAQSGYLGWVEDDGTVWRADGSLVGELTEANYILRNSSRIAPLPRIPKIPPVPPVPPIPSINRIGKIGRLGWGDALDDFRG